MNWVWHDMNLVWLVVAIVAVLAYGIGGYVNRPRGTWYHLAVTSDEDGGMAVYVDGEKRDGPADKVETWVYDPQRGKA